MIHKKAIFILSFFLLLAACAQGSGEIPTNAPVAFVTSTLPPYNPGMTVPTAVPPTATVTPNALTPSLTPSCRDSALFVEDVSYPDNTHVNAGEKFTKMWKIKNNGSCKWTGFTVAFVSGDRMEAPDSIAVPETEANATAEVSVDLVAPSTDGAYTGNFELRNKDGKVIPLGTESSFWVKILVGDETAANGPKIGNCPYTENPDYVKTLIELINKARADAGRAALTVNPKLSAAARAHSLDMACNNFMRHSGSDGSWTGDRLTGAGYTNPFYVELLAIGLPQDAMNQWHIDKNQWNSVLNARVTEIGVGYAFSKFSAYGGYWTVDMGGS